MAKRISLAAIVWFCCFPAWYAGADAFNDSCTGSVLLGGERWPELVALRNELRERLAVNDLARAVELQREIAKMQCREPYQRYYLAELLIQQGDAEAAVVELDGVYDLGVNDMETRLFDAMNPLHALVESKAYTESRLARRIAEKRTEAEARRAAFRTRLNAMPASERPPDPYVAKNVCPFECCSYRRWSVLEDTSLVAAPGSSEVVGTARKGTHVEGLTGDVHRVPLPIGVVHAAAAYNPTATVRVGEIVFELDPMGEGFAHVFRAGVVHEMSVFEEVGEQCSFPAQNCWGEYLVPREERTEPVWWVKVRLPDGVEGWTSEIHFGDLDACG